MSLRTPLLLIAALGLALVTALLMKGWMHAQRADLAARAAKVAPTHATEILVAKADLPVGRFIRAADLTWQVWPAKGLAANYVVRDQGSEKPFLGAVVRHPLLAGQPVSEQAVVKPGDRGFLAAVLKPGDRAVAVRVTATSGIAGLVFPGDHVDIILTQTLQRRQGDETVRRHASLTVLHDIRVLAIDQSLAAQTAPEKDGKGAKGSHAAAGPEGTHTATLEVTPKQGEIVAVAAEMGNLSLELRSLASPAHPKIADAAGAAGAAGTTGVVGATGAAAVTTYTLDNQVSRLLPPLDARAAPPPATQQAPMQAMHPERQTQTVVVLRGSTGTSVSTPAGSGSGQTAGRGPPPYVPAPSPYARAAANRMMD